MRRETVWAFAAALGSATAAGSLTFGLLVLMLLGPVLLVVLLSRHTSDGLGGLGMGFGGTWLLTVLGSSGASPVPFAISAALILAIGAAFTLVAVKSSDRIRSLAR